MAAAKGDAKSKAALDSMQVDMAARQRVADANRRAVQIQQEQRQAEIERQQAELAQQQEERKIAEQKIAKCIDDGDTFVNRLGCVDSTAPIFRLIPGCLDRQKSELVARCNGILIPPQQQQIIIQQGGGNQDQSSNLNKCMQDGGSLYCPNDPRTKIKPFTFPKY